MELLKFTQKINEQKNIMEKDMRDKYIKVEDEKNIHEGSCYCFSDPTRPFWRKIGRTKEQEKILVKQYSPRYMPEGINIIKWLPFSNSVIAEKCIFEKLKNYRIGESEWFKFTDLDEEGINKKIDTIFNNYTDFIKEESLE